jgi:plastocyanin
MFAVSCSAGGCAGGASEASLSPSVVVKVRDDRFDPGFLQVRVGTTVEWRNASMFTVHTITCDPTRTRREDYVMLPEGALPFASGRLGPGDRFRHTFSVPGRFRYFCIPHQDQGMIGEVEVHTQ